MAQSSSSDDDGAVGGGIEYLLRHVLPPLLQDSRLTVEDRLWLAARHAVLVEMAARAPTDKPLQLKDLEDAYLRVLAMIEGAVPGLTGAAGLQLSVAVPMHVLPGLLLGRARQSLQVWREERLKPALAPDAPLDESLRALRLWEGRLHEGAAEGSAGLGLAAVRRRAEAKRMKGWKSPDLPDSQDELRELLLDSFTEGPALTWHDQESRQKSLRWRVGRDGRYHVNENLLVDRLAALLRKRDLIRPRSDTECSAPEAIVDPDSQDALQALEAAEALEAIRALQGACIQEGPAARAAFVRVCASLVGESAPSRRSMAEESSPPTTQAAIRHAEQSVRPRVEALLRRFG